MKQMEMEIALVVVEEGMSASGFLVVGIYSNRI